MAVDVEETDTWLVRNTDGLVFDFEALQGLWTEAQYLKLTDQTNHLIEFTDGVIEVLLAGFALELDAVLAAS